VRVVIAQSGDSGSKIPARGTFGDVSDRLNAAIELHDSVVAEISRLESTVEITLRPAYVHQSAGEPGVEDGIGLVQNVVISIEEGSVKGDVGELPTNIFDGEFELGQQAFPNMIALPCDFAGAVTLTLFLCPDNRKLVISGKRVAIRLEGQASYVEEFRR
jgi:hypothetical protein